MLCENSRESAIIRIYNGKMHHRISPQILFVSKTDATTQQHKLHFQWFICHYNLSHSGRQLYRTAAPRRHVRESSNPTNISSHLCKKLKNVHAEMISSRNVPYITDSVNVINTWKASLQTAKYSRLPFQSRESEWCGSWAHGWVGWSLHCGLWLWEGTWGRNSKESVTF